MKSVFLPLVIYKTFEFNRLNSRSNNQLSNISLVLIIFLLAYTAFSNAFADPLNSPLPSDTIPNSALLKVVSGDVTFDLQTKTNIQNSNLPSQQVLGISQLSQKAIIEGSQFNIGSSSVVNFHHTGGAGSATLIRIINSFDPTRIEGQLNSPNGQIYLINSNGLIFGENSTVNASSFVASSLNITDKAFNQGFLLRASRNEPVFNGSTGYVQVDSGAKLTSAIGGKIMLFAPNVSNAGTIITPEGQTVLAAGEKVYLAISENSNLRGLLVEVDAGGSVTQATNSNVIFAERGNVTIAGLIINQNGIVKATTSVNANGSIKLQASKVKDVDLFLSADGGKVNLGRNSITEVLVDTSDKSTVIDSTPVEKSFIEISGSNIHVKNDAWIIAPSGVVEIFAAKNFVKPIVTSESFAQANDSHIYFETGSGIDVSGIGSSIVASSRSGETAAKISVETNIVRAELRGSELRDSPLQRNGILYTAKVYVDSRKSGITDATSNIADFSGYISQIGRGVSERMASGGAVSIKSEGDIVFSSSASVNVSGGKVDYLGGIVQTTNLIASNGVSYDISSAPKELKYDSILNTSSYEHGYTEGKDAGSVIFSAPAMLLKGKLVGDVTTGIHQDSLEARPVGGSLQIGQNTFKDGGTIKPIYNTNVLHSNLVLDLTSPNSITPSYEDVLLNGLSVEEKQNTVLGHNFIAPLGFSHLKYNADGQIIVQLGSELKTAPGGSITINGSGVKVLGNLLSPGGTISLLAKNMPGYMGLDITESNIELGSAGKIDVSGLWINDMLGYGDNRTIVTNAGNIYLSAYTNLSNIQNPGGDVFINNGGIVNASGGAWLTYAGKLNSGNGGSINIRASVGVEDQYSHIGKVIIDGTLRADSLAKAKGGILNLTSGSVTIGSEALQTSGELLLNPAFFTQGGFSDYKVSSYEGLTLTNGTVLKPVSLSRILNRSYLIQASGSDISTFSHLELLEAGGQILIRNPTNLSLTASTQSFGSINIETDSEINMDPSATLNLDARKQMTIFGALTAPSGNISIKLGSEPSSSELVMYSNTQTIWLGDGSKLDVSAVADTYLNEFGFLIGNIKDAGSITINALKGAVVSESNAVVNLNGTRAMLDLNKAAGFVRTDIASKGGNLIISAREGVLWDASMKANGGSDKVSAGNFSLSINKSLEGSVNALLPEEDPKRYPVGPRTIVVGLSGKSLHDALLVNGPIGSEYNGQAYVFTDNLASAGFESVSLASRDNIRFVQNSILNTRGEIKLDAPNLIVNQGITATLNSSYVGVGNGQPLYQARYNSNNASGFVREPIAETGMFLVNAQHIDLYGNQSVSASKGATFNSSGDIELQGVLPLDLTMLTPNGGINAAGNLTFSAARIYPSTLSEYSIKTADAGVVSFKRIGQDTGVPYSVMGTLNVIADTINQAGVLRAPLGVINLYSNNELTLAPGSLTSVSAEGKTLPFGVTTNRNNWFFDFGDRNKIFAALPDKSINLVGNSVKVDSAMNGLAAAKIDIAGGGDLMAWEFTTGTGGSNDVLADNSIFAVLPGLRSGYMPGSSESYRNSNINPGDLIYLSGGNGLDAGNYVLLPAHYALLKGAYSVKAVSGTQDMFAQQNIIKTDGSMIVSGYKMQHGGLVADARSSGFLVASGAIARTESEYTTTLASEFFKVAYSNSNFTGYRLPDDAGSLAISAVTSLVINGNLTMLGAKSGRGAEVDISAPKIAISGNATTGGNDYLTLSSAMLNAMEAESLLIGGKRASVASGTQLDVTAKNVELIGFANISGKEIILAAKDKVLINSGSSVGASDKAIINNGNLIVGKNPVYDSEGAIISEGVSGDGAILRVSAGDQRSLTRLNLSKSQGTLDIDGSIINAKSVLLDATYSNILKGTIAMRSGGSLSVGAPIISFGTTTAPVGLLFNTARLSALGSPSSLTFNSYSTLDFYGSVSIGDKNLEHLSINGAGINGYANTDEKVMLTAKRVDFANTGDVYFSSPRLPGAGSLVVNAEEIISGSNSFKTAGFSQLTLNAFQLKTQNLGVLDIDGNIFINTKRITSASLADSIIRASGSLQTSSSPVFPIGLSFDGDDMSALAAAFGGKLTLTASTINHAGNIEMPAGIVTLKATGAGDRISGNSITLEAGAKVSTKGSSKMLGSVQALVDGGRVNLITTDGNILMENTAMVDVSAMSGSAAGSMGVISNGVAKLLGTLNGAAYAENNFSNPTQGSFEYYASRFLDEYDFKNLNTALETGGFQESRNIHVTQGDLNLANTVSAHNLTLTTDDGNINLAGTGQINAYGIKGGSVNLNAGQKNGSGNGNIYLASGATINASATTAAKESAGSAGDGGKVILSTSTDSNLSPTAGSHITLAIDSVINLSKGVDSNGNGMGSDGTLVLRTPRTGIVSSENSGTGVNLTATISGENVKGSNATILIEGNKVFAHAGNLSINTNYANTLKSNNSSFLINANSIKTSINTFSDARVSVIAGDEVTSTGSITIANDINLQSWEPGALTLRAASDITVSSSISAGFTNQFKTGVLTGGGNWTYRMIAGADLQSADVRTTNNNLIGNFTLAANKIIRTGTGDIEIVTGGNFALGSSNSVIYTAGEKDNTDYSSQGTYKSLLYYKSDANNVSMSSTEANFTYNGGGISIDSKGAIKGAYSSQLPSSWLLRQGGSNIYNNEYLNTSWGYYFDDFNENIGTFGGGDITINAGQDIHDLSAVIATNARYFLKSELSSIVPIINGGGDLNIKASGNINGGLYMIDGGTGNIRTFKGIMAGDMDSDSQTKSPYNTAIALGNGKVNIQTAGNLELSTIFNPFAAGNSWTNSNPKKGFGYTSFFLSYTHDSAALLTSVGGGVSFMGADLLYDSVDMPKDDWQSSSLQLIPGILEAKALNGNIVINKTMGMASSVKRDLKLSASGSIEFLSESYLVMSDQNPYESRSPLFPSSSSDFISSYLLSNMNGSELHTDKLDLVYENNNPVTIYAGKNIIGTNAYVSLIVPKKAEIYAGGDIEDFSLLGQNLRSFDATSIIAAGNIVFNSNLVDSKYLANFRGILWGGPGYLNISAGKSVILSNSNGIVTKGNLINPYLSETGASIRLIAGVSNTKDIDIDGLYLNNLIQSKFFNELKIAGIEHNDSGSDGYGNYKRGYDAIKTMFAESKNFGNVDLSGSQIKTERGGDLNLMVPNGRVLVGLPKVPPSLIAAKDDTSTSYDDSPSILGLFTVKGGNVNVFSRDSVEVAQSRVFTVGGGDVLIWSTLGNIDAGKGAKTATSAPPPLVRTDINGNTVIDLAGLVTGSGIGTIQSLGSTSIGNVYLIAPSGTVDAGDAGVRSSGNLLVAAQAVANGANMQAGGASSGVPAPSTANVSFSAPVSADSSNSSKQADKATEAASKSANKSASALPSLITVEVLSLGDEASTTSDLEKDEKKKVKKQQN